MPPQPTYFARMRIALQTFLWPNSDFRTPAAGAQTPEDEYKLFLDDLNDKNFSWLFFFVAASGFCTDSYSLFASNVILPELGYVYWDNNTYAVKSLAFNLATLAASAVGQLLFGLLADLVGRRSLYGIELVIVIISTLGLLQCSRGWVEEEGFTWHIAPWLIFWRSVMGLGIGAEYPMSACIGAEWSSPKWRGRMMSAVFLMQPIGQLSAYGAGLTGVRHFDGSRIGIDRAWRYVVGIGVIPTMLALASRLMMPEGGRYYYEVTERINLSFTTSDENDGPPESLWHYLFHQGHWVYLAGTSICWFLLDIVFYGIGFNNPSTLSKLWSPHHISFPSNATGWLNTSSIQVASNATVVESPEIIIKEVLTANITHAIYTVAIPSIVGSIAMICFIDYFHRKHMLTTTFAILGILLIVIGASFRALFHQEEKHIVLVALWIVMSFFFSFGPNTLTFIIPAEVFPTRYRCTFYGIAAASGKLGALLAQIIVSEIGIVKDVNTDNIRWALIAFAFCMFLGALCSHLTLPSVQAFARDPPPWYQNIPLEILPPDPPAWAKGVRRRRGDPEAERGVSIVTSEGLGSGMTASEK